MYGKVYKGAERITFVVDSDGKVVAVLRKVKPAEHDALNMCAELRKRMLDAGELRGRERVRASIALSGWLAFVRTVCVEWLADPEQTISREEMRDMCMSTLLSTLGSEPSSITGPSTTVLR